MAGQDWLAWAALTAALSVTASAEYGLARDCGFGAYVAAGVPAALDIYAVRAFRAHRDVAAAVGAMIVVNTLAHLVDARRLAVSVPLVVLVSVLAPLVVWRVHRIGTTPPAKGEPVGQPTAPLPPVGVPGPAPTGRVPGDFADGDWEPVPVAGPPVAGVRQGAEALALPPALPALDSGSPTGSPAPSALPAQAPGAPAAAPSDADGDSVPDADAVGAGWDSTRARTDEELLALARDVAAAGESTSASALMRRFGIGATRAARIRDALTSSPSPGRESAA
jgi:hypothetical protein